MLDILSTIKVGLTILLVTSVLHISKTEAGPGTTLNIDRIFIGRCLEYQELFRGKLLEPTQINCTELWSIFRDAWTYKNPRSISRTDYDNFFEIAQQTYLPKDKVLFWSGTYEVAHEYSNSGTRFVTLEDTLIGYLVNGLTWCGMMCDTCDGINYDECPDFPDLPRRSSHAFWGGASSTFASMASGVARLMLNGTNQERPAYSRESFFGQFELPVLSKDVQLQVILVNDLNKVPLEHCDMGSLADLRKDVENRGMLYSCVENPPDVVHLLCVGDNDDSKCIMGNKEHRAVPLRKLMSSRSQVGKK